MITFSRLWEEEEARLIIKEEKMGATKDQALEEPLIHISIRNNDIMNKEDDEAEGSRRSLPVKQIKISIQLSLFCYAFVYIQLICYA